MVEDVKFVYIMIIFLSLVFVAMSIDGNPILSFFKFPQLLTT